jgi:hypothetical protein
MTASNSGLYPLFGYLAFVEFAAHGIVGGYLLVNRHARPVEFHCTAPLLANRAQEILYGPTLRSYLYSDQIGQTLVSECKQTVHMILTDQPLALRLRTHVDIPLVLLRHDEVAGADDGPAAERGTRLPLPLPLQSIALELPVGFDVDRSAVAALVEQCAGWDLSEPLNRIREAIHEAHQAAA